jgi:hypothetical protein
MRRPAQHRPALAAALAATGNGWTHPYTGPLAHAVFYNDGGDPATPPTPADPPKPGPPPGPAKEFTQEDLDRIAAREKAQGKRSALKDFAEEHGFTSPEDAAEFIAAARKAKEDALSDEEKRRQELERREQELTAKETAALARERAAIRKAAVMGLGAMGEDLADALAILDRDLADQPEADETAVTAAAEALKTRRPALFGQAPAAGPPPQPGLPPAPGGAPAGGGPKPQASKDDVKDRARKRAEQMGFRSSSAA